MTETDRVSAAERQYLRELARKQADYAQLPVMEERRRAWIAHNTLRGSRPMLVMELDTFIGDFLPKPRCVSGIGRQIEHQLLCNVLNHELVDDDKVVRPYFQVCWNINFTLFDLQVKVHKSDDGHGGNVGYSWEHPLSNLGDGLPGLKPSTQSVDREGTMAFKAAVEEVIGDILPVRVENTSLTWFFMPTARVIPLLGMEAMMIAMMDEPGAFNELMTRICDDMIAHLRWQEKEGLLTLNNANHYAGAGSYGFTDELPAGRNAGRGLVTSRDLWANMNSQESVGISPAMFGEFMFPHYRRLAKEFGLVYFGCCEPVHDFWTGMLETLPRLRKVSISPWCNEELMGERLAGGRVIYSRKPSPNHIGVGDFDEQGYAASITRTLKAAKGCTLEIIHRDIYTINGDTRRPGRAIAIARRLIENR